MSWFGRNKDLLFVAGVIAAVMVVFVPLPTPVLDVLLIASITVSLLMLLSVIYVKEPLALSVFPTLLLLTTAYRLSLNVATTRLILSDARTEGTLAAGRVVRAFGEFVAGNEVLVGFVIFIVLVIINFVVITKGATRISEVAARFALDAMPGKQMAIDAELNAGAIQADEARRRRERLAREADFYGAMDGATKFVRGDAVAGLLITLVNILGGVALGMLQYGMPFTKALSTFTILTIGDGLVAAVPALLVSIAAGLMVTRTSAATNLGQDVIGQLFLSDRRALGVAGVVLLGLALTALAGSGMPWLPLLAVAGLLAALTRGLARGAQRAQQEAARKELERPPERLEALLHVEPLQLDLGIRLVRHADRFAERIAPLRRELATDLGIIVPPVVVREGERIDPQGYCVRLRGIPVARGTVRPGEVLAINEGQAREPLDGTPAADPVFGRPAFWVPEAAAARARELKYYVVDAVGVAVAHLRDAIRRRAAELLSRDDVGTLLRTLKEKRPAVVEEVVPALVKPGELQKVLQNLLREGVSIRDLGTILEALGDAAARTKDPDALTEQVRAALGRAIVQKHLEPDGKLYVITLDPRLEEAVRASVERADGAAALPPELFRRVSERVAREIDRMALAGRAPVLLVSASVRPAVKRLTEAIRPGVAVLSYGEIVKEIQIVSGGVVSE